MKLSLKLEVVRSLLVQQWNERTIILDSWSQVRLQEPEHPWSGSWFPCRRRRSRGSRDGIAVDIETESPEDSYLPWDCRHGKNRHLGREAGRGFPM